MYTNGNINWKVLSMKNKLLLLATAAVFMSPVAAKANSKGSVYVGLTGTFERLATQGDKAAVSDYLKDENFLSFGIEAGYGYKVWNNLQLAGWVRGLYSMEHAYPDSKKLTSGAKRSNDPYAIIIEPRVTLGWEFPVSGSISITPFVGAGVEVNVAKTKNKDTEFETQWKIPAVAGIRANFGYVYATINGRFDLTTSEVSDAEPAVDRLETDKVRSWGIEASIGAEF
jgi:opacity protein-like surface antigen